MPWPPLTYEDREWTSRLAPDALSRNAWAELQRPYRASVPPRIADAFVTVPQAVAAEAEDAAAALVRFDADVGHINAPFAAILLRSESASSSQIENLTSGARAIAEAQLGERDEGNAALVVSNVEAMHAALDLADDISNTTIIAMQRALLERSRPELTGAYRREQVWIGGGDRSPHTAQFVPPHHSRVEAAMNDLVDFAARTDIPALSHTALTHAQFETIHPFLDGNGRTGRALVQSMLRHAGLTRTVTAPLSAGLLRRRDRYFGALSAFREGDPVPIVEVFTEAAFLAVTNGRTLAEEIETARAGWRERLAGTRRSAAAHRLIDLATESPVLNSRLVQVRLGLPPKTALAALDRLSELAIIRPATSQRRNRIWLVPAVLAALDSFAERSARRA